MGIGTTAMAWEAARARTATERVNFIVGIIYMCVGAEEKDLVESDRVR